MPTTVTMTVPAGRVAAYVRRGWRADGRTSGLTATLSRAYPTAALAQAAARTAPYPAAVEQQP